jgi:hypothetical protein
MIHFGRGQINACQMLLWIVVLFGLLIWQSELRAEEWREDDSEHFVVFYLQDADFASEVVGRAEEHYDRINVDLGLTHVVKRERAPRLLENRCRIYLYNDKDEYVKATGSPDWSEGKVNYRERIIWSFSGSEHFLDNLLPHEIAHILFREYVGFDNNYVPQWLDEGVAQSEEAGRVEKSLEIMKKRLEEHDYLPLSEIDRVNLESADERKAELFYAQSVTLVHFLLSEYGELRFIDLCSALRDGQALEPALSIATGGLLRSMSELEDAWKDFILGRP